MVNLKEKFHGRCIGLLSHYTISITAHLTGLALSTYINRLLGT